jgi:hypothetical protein
MLLKSMRAIMLTSSISNTTVSKRIPSILWQIHREMQNMLVIGHSSETSKRLMEAEVQVSGIQKAPWDPWNAWLLVLKNVKKDTDDGKYRRVVNTAVPVMKSRTNATTTTIEDDKRHSNIYLHSNVICHYQWKRTWKDVSDTCILLRM